MVHQDGLVCLVGHLQVSEPISEGSISTFVTRFTNNCQAEKTTVFFMGNFRGPSPNATFPPPEIVSLIKGLHSLKLI